MRKPAIIALSGVALVIASMGVVVYWFVTIDDVPSWNYEYKLFPTYFLLIGFVIIVIASMLNYLEYKQGKVKSYWIKDWQTDENS